MRCFTGPRHSTFSFFLSFFPLLAVLVEVDLHLHSPGIVGQSAPCLRRASRPRLVTLPPNPMHTSTHLRAERRVTPDPKQLQSTLTSLSTSLCPTSFDSAGWTTSRGEIMCHSVRLGHILKRQHFSGPLFGALSLIPCQLHPAFRQFGPAPSRCDCRVNEALPFYLCSAALTIFFGVTAQIGPCLKCLNCDDLSECICFPFCGCHFFFFVLTMGNFVVRTDTYFFLSPKSTTLFCFCICAIILAFT